MLRLSWDAVNAVCGCEFSTTGRMESCSRSCDARTLSTKPGQSGTIENSAMLARECLKSRSHVSTNWPRVPQNTCTAVWRERATAMGREQAWRRRSSHPALGIILRAAAPGTNSPPIHDDNGLLEQRLDHRIILPAGPFNHVTADQANKCCDEAFRDGDRAPR